jgi:hypothetical protein
MCRNITTLRGLEPPATSEEIEAAARQYVRKVSGITHPAPATEEAFERAVVAIARVTADVLSDLPPRRQPPPTLPPLRRPQVRARLVSAEAVRDAFAGAPKIDAARFRADVDSRLDQDPTPRT